MLENHVIAHRYHIQHLLAYGGNAWVYRARDTHTDDLIALRYLRCVDDQSEWMFERETRVVNALNHPNIISYLDMGTYQCGYFVTMPLLKGTLAQHYQHPVASSEDVQERLEFLMPVLDALEYLHQRNIVHGDIKGSNILLDTEGRAILCDFGVAHDYSMQRIKHIAVAMTFSHASPEAVRGKRLRPASDLYSLGCLFYEILLGVAPFGMGNQPELVVRHLHDTPPSADELNRHISPALSQVFMRLLAKDAEARYENITALRQALRKALRQPVVIEPKNELDVAQLHVALAPHTLQSMQAASLLPDGADSAQLSYMLGVSEQRIVLDVQALCAQGILEEVSERYCFVTEALRKEVAQGVSERRKKRYLSRLAKKA